MLRGSGVEKLRPLISSTEPLQHQCFGPHLVQTPLGIETWCEHWTPSQTEDMPTIEKKKEIVPALRFIHSQYALYV